MQKIPTLFERDEATNRKHVKNEVNPVAKWVLDGEGRATRKYDGTCCLIENGVLYKRHEVKPGNSEPNGFREIDHDDVTGKRVGWVEVRDGLPEDKWHLDGLRQTTLTLGHPMEDGTYELCGPKIQGNPEGLEVHLLIPHGKLDMDSYTPRDFDGLRAFLTADDFDAEGIVWHHPDGRMAKLKKRDFPSPIA